MRNNSDKNNDTNSNIWCCTLFAAKIQSFFERERAPQSWRKTGHRCRSISTASCCNSPGPQSSWSARNTVRLGAVVVVLVHFMVSSSSYCLRKHSPTGKKSQIRCWYIPHTYDSCHTHTISYFIMILARDLGMGVRSPHTGANGVSWPPWKMDEKLKSENSQKRAVFYVYVIFWEQSGQAGVENGAMLTTFIQIYFRMHHFVVKFSKLSSPQAARGQWPPNQNPADVPWSG